jgi:hypothetical protein
MLKASPNVRFWAQCRHRKPFALITSSRPTTTADSTHDDDGRQRGSEHHRDIDANRRQRQRRGH